MQKEKKDSNFSSKKIVLQDTIFLYFWSVESTINISFAN